MLILEWKFVGHISIEKLSQIFVWNHRNLFFGVPVKKNQFFAAPMKGMAKRGFRCWKQKSDIAFWQKYAPKTYIPHLRINILPPESFFPLPTGKGEVIWRGEVGVSDTQLCSKSSSQINSKYKMGTGEDRVRFGIERCCLINSFVSQKKCWHLYLTSKSYLELLTAHTNELKFYVCEQASWPRVKILPLGDFDPKDLI